MPAILKRKQPSTAMPLPCLLVHRRDEKNGELSLRALVRLMRCESLLRFAILRIK